MQGAEIEDDGSVLKYMTKSEIEEQRSSLLIMTQRLFVACGKNIGFREATKMRGFILTERQKVEQSY